jgi:hypothetical protein
VAELLISSRRTSEGDLRSLMDRLSVAIPDAESPLHRELVEPCRRGLLCSGDVRFYAVVSAQTERSSRSSSSERPAESSC